MPDNIVFDLIQNLGYKPLISPPSEIVTIKKTKESKEIIFQGHPHHFVWNMVSKGILKFTHKIEFHCNDGSLETYKAVYMGKFHGIGEVLDQYAIFSQDKNFISGIAFDHGVTSEKIDLGIWNIELVN